MGSRRGAGGDDVSEILTLEARLLLFARNAIAGLTVSDQPPAALDAIPETSLPFGYVDAFAKRSVARDAGSEDRVLEGAVVLVSNVSLEHARELGDRFEAAIVADRTLAGLVTTTTLEIEAGSTGRTRHAAVCAVRAVVRDGSSASAGGPLVRYEVRARARLRSPVTGTTPAQYRTELAAALVALLGGASAARFASDLENPPSEAVPASSTRFGLSTLSSELVISSNVTGILVSIALRVFHRGAAGDAERDYTEGAMAVETATLLGVDFWKLGKPDVDVDAEELPEISFPGDVARV